MGINEKTTFRVWIDEIFGGPMLKVCCVPFLRTSSQEISDQECERKVEIRGTCLPMSLPLSKNVFVKIVHAGGRVELYKNAVDASMLMEKYPGMCVARPDVFKDSHNSLLVPESILLPGNKYYMLPSTTARKLKRRHLRKISKITGSKEVKAVASTSNWDAGGENSDQDSLCSGQEFYVPSCLLRNSSIPEKPFEPPLPKARMCNGLGWAPRLTSVQEVSP